MSVYQRAIVRLSLSLCVCVCVCVGALSGQENPSYFSPGVRHAHNSPSSAT